MSKNETIKNLQADISALCVCLELAQKTCNGWFEKAVDIQQEKDKIAEELASWIRAESDAKRAHEKTEIELAALRAQIKEKHSDTTNIKALKKWQRKGGNVQYIPLNTESCVGSNFNFQGPGAYIKVETSWEERMQNLLAYQKAGGKVEGRDKRKYNPDSKWRVNTWRFDNRKMKYRKVTKF